MMYATVLINAPQVAVGSFTVEDSNTNAALYRGTVTLATTLEFGVWGSPNAGDEISYRPGAIEHGVLEVSSISSEPNQRFAFTFDANIVPFGPGVEQPGAILCADNTWHVVDNGASGEY